MADKRIIDLTDLGVEPAASDVFELVDVSDTTDNPSGTSKKVSFSNLTGSFLKNVVEDTTPQLGGDLDLNSNDITGTGNINITGTGTFSGALAASNVGQDVTSGASPTFINTNITEGTNLYYTDERAQDSVGTILTDSSEIDFTYNDATPSITASLIAGSIDETKLDTSVNASLDLADSALQSGDNISELTNDSGYITDITAETIQDLSNVTFTTLSTGDFIRYNGTNFVNTTLSASDIPALTASKISDFDTEVSNNTDVSANTSARHNAVTVTDSSEINFTLTGQNITASLITGSIDETKLDTSVNASLDLADSALQSGDNISELTNDAGYITSTLSNEQVQDVVGGMVTGNTETLITVTYQDVDGTLDFVVDNDLSNYDNSTSGFITDSSTDSLTNKTINTASNTITINASDVSDFDTEVSNNTDVTANTTHRSSDGSDHSFINQNVTTTASPTFSTLDISSKQALSTSGGFLRLDGSGEFTFGVLSQNNHRVLGDLKVDNNSTLGVNGTGIDISGGSRHAWFVYDDADGTFTAQVSPSINMVAIKGYNGFSFHTDTNNNIVVMEQGGNVGIGTTSPSSKLDVNGNIDYTTATGETSSIGNLGTTQTIDWSTATHFEGTLNADVTITHSNETSGQKVTLALAYDGTAQRTITWSDVDKWAGGSAPDAPSASGEVLVVTMIFLGTTCYASAEVFS